MYTDGTADVLLGTVQYTGASPPPPDRPPPRAAGQIGGMNMTSVTNMTGMGTDVFLGMAEALPAGGTRGRPAPAAARHNRSPLTQRETSLGHKA